MEAWSFLNHRAMKSNTHITRHFERLEKSNENTSELLFKTSSQFINFADYFVYGLYVQYLSVL